MRLDSKKTASGITPLRQVASRWFNLATIISSTDDDIGIQRARDKLWAVVDDLPARRASVFLEARIGASLKSQRGVVIHKPTTPWSDRSKKGNRLRFSALHPKAREFLFTDTTLQQISVGGCQRSCVKPGGIHGTVG